MGSTRTAVATLNTTAGLNPSPCKHVFLMVFHEILPPTVSIQLTIIPSTCYRINGFRLRKNITVQPTVHGLLLPFPKSALDSSNRSNKKPKKPLHDIWRRNLFGRYRFFVSWPLRGTDDPVSPREKKKREKKRENNEDISRSEFIPSK